MLQEDSVQIMVSVRACSKLGQKLVQVDLFRVSGSSQGGQRVNLVSVRVNPVKPSPHGSTLGQQQSTPGQLTRPGNI
ncbi:hypothetical protein HanPSC8_Chr02g0075381 [Helianthus annuus]|nr:hypothetical protein HanPSC8_Chr02g0075381 [Helianthus annuus]